MAVVKKAGKYVFGIGSKTIGILEEAKSALSSENTSIEQLVADTIDEAVSALDGAELIDVDLTLFKKGMALSVLAIAKGVEKDGS